MREWLNQILSFIGTTSLTDEEWGAMNVLHMEVGVYNQAAYDELVNVLKARNAVDDTIKRLTGFFQAKGFNVTPAKTDSSQIFVGAVI